MQPLVACLLASVSRLLPRSAGLTCSPPPLLSAECSADRLKIWLSKKEYHTKNQREIIKLKAKTNKGKLQKQSSTALEVLLL